MDPNATPPSGVTINIPGYTLISELGKGGMATVYLAVQQNFGRKVALKIMSPALNADPTFSERFLREARIVAGLSHPNIVQVYDVGEFDNHHYIAMEYHPGGDLQERIAKGLSIEEAVRIIEQIALALDYAHSKGYIHRDVKPDNVLFREDGSAVLTDFGIAKPTNKGTRQMTQVGKVIGTPKYMSPEQARGQELDARSDLYALGVMFFEMLAGEVPFDGEDPIAIGIKHIKDPVPRLSGEAAVFQEVIETLMAKDVADRYQRGRDFAEAVEQVAYTHADGARRPSRGKLTASPSGRIGRVSTPASAAADKHPGGGRTALWASLAVAALVAGGAGGAWVLMPDNPLVQRVRSQIMGKPAATPVAAATPAPVAMPAPPAATPAPADTTAVATGEPVDSGTGAIPADIATTTEAPAGDTPAQAPADATPATSTEAPATGTADATPATSTEAPATGTADAAPATSTEAPATETADATPEPSTTPAAGPAVDDSVKPLVDRLLKEADTALDARQLTRPEGDNALDKYREVLQLDPDNAEARNGIRKIATVFIVMARESGDQRDFRAARQFLRQARELAPEAAGLDSAEKSLSSAEEKARQEQAAADQAAAEKAREANQADLMVARFRITGLLKTAEYQLANDQLAAPPGENAWDSYAEILKIDPDNARAKNGQKQVADRLVALIGQAIDASNGEKARDLMTQALRVIPNNPRIKEMRGAVDQLP